MAANNLSFVCMLISPLRLVNMYKKQKNFEVKLRRRGLINMQNKGIIYWPPFWNKVYSVFTHVINEDDFQPKQKKTFA